MALTPEQYRDEAEAALAKAKQVNGTVSSANAAAAGSHAAIAAGYTALYEAVGGEAP